MPTFGLTRRSFLGAAGIGTRARTAAGTGFATTGSGGMLFLSTQFRPIDEAERFRNLLGKTAPGVGCVTIEESPFASQVRSQFAASSTQVGLHGDIAPLADGYLEDLTGLLADLGNRGWPAADLQLARRVPTGRGTSPGPQRVTCSPHTPTRCSTCHPAWTPRH